jgi:hydrogenase maturation protease
LKIAFKSPHPPLLKRGEGGFLWVEYSVTMKTLLLGLGNTILKDDSVGLKVVRRLENKVAEEDFHLMEASLANIDLLESITSYDRLIIVDSIKTKEGKPGELYQLSLEDLRSTLHLSSPHDINLATALELGKRLGMHVPRVIRIYGIEVEDNQTFSETCSPSVEEAIPRIVEEIARAEQLEDREMNTLITDHEKKRHSEEPEATKNLTIC